MSFLDRISPFFPELSELSDNQPFNYSSAKDALIEFNTIKEKIGIIYKDFRSAVLSQTEKDYKNKLDEEMIILGSRLKAVEKEYAKPFLKEQKKIFNEAAKSKFSAKENLKNMNSKH